MLHGENTHHDVLEEEVRGTFLVRPDTTDETGEVEDDVDVDLVEQTLHIGFAGQVVVAASNDGDLATALFLERLDHVTAEEASSTGHQDAPLAPVAHSPASLSCSPWMDDSSRNAARFCLDLAFSASR